ncbi:MAG: hypothetical protein FRX48_07888 [Lasallia pustulata]|uniref:Uncharacterized protein n=1 Tax=Lasallia pustulata TaxID=136370 RepID=A0A5M8PH07_9LECA|nr:MAG: hypothetical protein FRX48_07888 [Lasallia pustulata]
MWFHQAPDPLLPWHAKNSRYIGISEELLRKSKLYSEYAAAAYCIASNDSLRTQVTCLPKNCELAEAANAMTISEFVKTEVTGFIVIDKLHRVIFLAFRGSRPKKNWFADLDIAKRQTNLCYQCRVHQGFWNS